VDWDDGSALHATGVAFWPTQGGFEERANRNLRDVRVLGGVFDVRPSSALPRTQVQAFVWNYRDTRPITGRPDNMFRPASGVDVDITTFGGSLVASYPTAAGAADVLAWIAVQTGDWYETSHGAAAFALEGGHQWTDVPGRPWVRGGWNRASGDDK